jgi:hypothetical protein
MTIPYVSPSPFAVFRSEVWPLGFDATALLAVGDTISTPAAVLRDVKARSVVVLAHTPTVVGNVITQIVDGSQLIAGKEYRLEITFTANTNKIVTMPLVISVPF